MVAQMRGSMPLFGEGRLQSPPFGRLKPPLPNHQDQIHETDEIDEIDEIDQIDQTDETTWRRELHNPGGEGRESGHLLVMEDG